MPSGRKMQSTDGETPKHCLAHQVDQAKDSRHSGVVHTNRLAAKRCFPAGSSLRELLPAISRCCLHRECYGMRSTEALNHLIYIVCRIIEEFLQRQSPLIKAPFRKASFFEFRSKNSTQENYGTTTNNQLVSTLLPKASTHPEDSSENLLLSTAA